MALPTTPAQIEALNELYSKCRDELHTIIQQSFFVPLLHTLVRRVFLQRPHTDDMMQMLDDLGIEPPAYQTISYDGLTFRLPGGLSSHPPQYPPVNYNTKEFRWEP